jgi:NAD-reducing hydrogenase large subunit
MGWRAIWKTSTNSPSSPDGYFGQVTPNNSLELYDGDIRLVDQDGDQLEKFDGRKYLDYIAEHVENWSYLKFPYYKKMGWPGGVYRVGPAWSPEHRRLHRNTACQRRAQIWKQINAANRLRIRSTSTMLA